MTRKRPRKQAKGPAAAAASKPQKTATQLRNERKRRSVKKKKLEKKRKRLELEKKADPSQKHIDHPLAAPTVKRAKDFFSRQRVAFSVSLGPLNGWRCHTKLAVRQREGSAEPVVGIFAPGTHDVVPNSGTSRAHHVEINRFVPALVSRMKKEGVRGYDEASAASSSAATVGMLNYVVINSAISRPELQVTLVLNADAFPDVPPEILSLARSLEDCMPPSSSMFLHLNKCESYENNIFARKENSWKHLYGPKVMKETLDLSPAISYRLPLTFPPSVFRQSNLSHFKKIISSIIASLPSSSPSILELYGGVGTVGLHCLEKCSWLTCSDENPNNVKAFNESKASLPKKLQKKVEYVSYNAEDMVKEGYLEKDYEVCLLDPPRKGCSTSVLSALVSSSSLKMIIYVSCGFHAFTEDSKKLQAGGWKITKAEGYVLFPGSDAIETLAVFERGDGVS